MTTTLALKHNKVLTAKRLTDYTYLGHLLQLTGHQRLEILGGLQYSYYLRLTNTRDAFYFLAILKYLNNRFKFRVESGCDLV